MRNLNFFLFLSNHLFNVSVRTTQDQFGLNMGLYEEISSVVSRLYKKEVTIGTESVERAVYFHGYLLEQTLQVFDISELSTIKEKKLSNSIQDSRTTIFRKILLFSTIVITKEDFYSIQG